MNIVNYVYTHFDHKLHVGRVEYGISKDKTRNVCDNARSNSVTSQKESVTKKGNYLELLEAVINFLIVLHGADNENKPTVYVGYITKEPQSL